MPIVDALLERISSFPLPFVGQRTGVDSADGFADFLRDEIQVDKDSAFDRQEVTSIRDEEEFNELRDARIDRDDRDSGRERHDRYRDDERRYDDYRDDERSDRSARRDADLETSERDEPRTNPERGQVTQENDPPVLTEKRMHGAMTAQNHANEKALTNANEKSALKLDLSAVNSDASDATATNDDIVAVTAAMDTVANGLSNSGQTQSGTLDVNSGTVGGNGDDTLDNKNESDTKDQTNQNSDQTQDGNDLSTIATQTNATSSFTELLDGSELVSNDPTIQVDPDVAGNTVNGTGIDANLTAQTNAVNTAQPDDANNSDLANGFRQDAEAIRHAQLAELPGLKREVEGIWTFRTPWLQTPGTQLPGIQIQGSNANIPGVPQGVANAQGQPVIAALANLGGDSSSGTSGNSNPGPGLDNFGQQVSAQAKQLAGNLHNLPNGDDQSAGKAGNLNQFGSLVSGKLAGAGTELSSGGATTTEANLTADTIASTTKAQNAQANTNAAANRPAPGSAANIQVAFHIARAVQDGNSRISIRLDPPELGRVDVRLELAGDGRVMATVSTERQDTLDLMQRDARDLERALNDAGLDASKDDLHFSLKQQGGNDQTKHGDIKGDGLGKQKPDHDDNPEDLNHLRRVVSDRALDVIV